MTTMIPATVPGRGDADPTPPLFEQTNVRKPEYWQFARLIAPAGALPEGRKQWTTDDAVGIWCLRCRKALVFQKGSSQSIRYHMETRHQRELAAFRDHATQRRHRSPPLGPQSQRPLPAAVAHTPLGPTTAANEETTTPSRNMTIRDSESGRKRKASEELPRTPVNAGGEEPEQQGTNSDDPRTPDAHAHGERPQARETEPGSSWTWTRNLERRGGFWGNAQWYDHHLERRLPLAKPLVEELVAALPPCDDRHVLDLCAGSGRAAEAVLGAYPTAFLTLVDASEERLDLAQRRLRSRGFDIAAEQLIRADLSPAALATASPVPVDVVVACLALHVLAERPSHYAVAGTDVRHLTPSANISIDDTYRQLFRGLLGLVKPGGHVIIGDHVGQLGLFRHLQLLAEVGFIDVDCAWRQGDMFVIGARQPE